MGRVTGQATSGLYAIALTRGSEVCLLGGSAPLFLTLVACGGKVSLEGYATLIASLT